MTLLALAAASDALHAQTATDAPRASDRIEKGTHMIGCDGEFQLTGGTGRFDGVTGGGPMLVRSGLHETRIDMQKGRVESAASGIIAWKNLRYVMP